MSMQNTTIDITRYTIISKIGEGGFSKVYRVKDLCTNKYYAAKVSNFMIDEETKSSTETISLFREVNLMSLLNHPSILKFIGYYPNNFEGDPIPTIVTELATNGSLRDIISMESQGLSPDEWNFTKKLINIYGISAGMSYLHSHNILHRDLKPENILIDDYLHPKISDFGLSKITDFLSVSMNVQSQRGLKGTPAYMAPEIFSSENYSKSSDVYAFGFIVYEIITCKEPFKNFNIYQLMKKVMNEGFRPTIDAGDAPNVYRELIERCWSQEPSDRPSFDQIVTELKTNSDFLIDLVDEAEYYDYIDFVDKYVSTFDVTKRIIHFSEFVKSDGRNKNVKPFLFNEFFSDESSATESSDQKFKSSETTSNENNYHNDVFSTKLKLDEKSKKIDENEPSSEKVNEISSTPIKINEISNQSTVYNLNFKNFQMRIRILLKQQKMI